jgi:hypothetical protein
MRKSTWRCIHNHDLTNHLTMQKLITAITIIIAAALAVSCNTDGNCFEDMTSVNTDPLRIDTLVLFDPKTYAKSCFITSYYIEGDISADSIFEIDEKVVELVKTEACYQLLSVKEKLLNCD